IQLIKAFGLVVIYPLWVPKNPVILGLKTPLLVISVADSCTPPRLPTAPDMALTRSFSGLTGELGLLPLFHQLFTLRLNLSPAITLRTTPAPTLAPYPLNFCM